MLIKKIRSEFPVAGPSAENANIKNPERNKCGVFCFTQTTIPAIIIGITVPKDKIRLIISAQPGVFSLEA